MKNYNKLITVLFVFSRFCFRLIFLFILIIIAAELFTTDGKIGSGSLSIHHSKGYSIPASLTPLGKLIQYSETDKNQKIPVTFKKLSFEKLDISGNVSLKSFNIIDFIPEGEMKFENLKYHYLPKEETNIMIKTSSPIINFFLGLRAYLELFFYLFITFYCTKIFKYLKKDQIFQPEISKYLNIIGILFMINEMLRIIYYLLLDKKIIELIQLRNDKIFDGFSLNNTFNFSLMPFIIGLTLMLLALVFRRGYDIQQENELTI